jgi:hypothetical protein
LEGIVLGDGRALSVTALMVSSADAEIFGSGV